MSIAPVVESVWDYPRPPRLERTLSHLRIQHAGVVIADTTRAWRVLETSHPPVFYLPPEDLRMDLLRPSQARHSFCEFKGVATYWNLDLSSEQLAGKAAGSSKMPGISVASIAWSYPEPTPKFAHLRDHLAFYASRVDECTVNGERVMAQAGDFYGGWITSAVQGPFKGAPGTSGW